MQTLNILYQSEFKIDDKIAVVVPTVKEVLETQDEYYSILNVLTGHPSDFMVPLDDIGIDFSEIDDYDLFLIMFPGIASRDTHLFFGDLDLSKFEFMTDRNTGRKLLFDRDNDIAIDRATHAKIAMTLRRIHKLQNKPIVPGNEEAKKYLIERTRKKLLRRRGKKEESELESLIISLVNTEQFKYNYQTVLDLSIIQFNESVHQIIRKDAYDKRMIGVYAGTVNAKELKPEELSWLATK